MTDSLDQIFVTLKHWLLGHLENILPPSVLPVVSGILSLAPVLMVFPALFAITTVLERKGLGRIQNRYGPNRVGPFGFLQFAADGIKALIKEDLVPRAADKFVHFLAPVILVIIALTVYAVIPFGRNMVVVDFDAGLLFFFAVGAASELAAIMNSTKPMKPHGVNTNQSGNNPACVLCASTIFVSESVPVIITMATLERMSGIS